jgi:uncharacterized lipoprotein YbaY
MIPILDRSREMLLRLNLASITVAIVLAIILLGWSGAAWAQSNDQTGSTLQVAQITPTVVPSGTPSHGTIVIKGAVQYLGAALPANATLWVSLQDAATGVYLIALEKEGVVGGKAQPFPFTMELDSSRVVASARYRVIAEITDSEQSRNRLYRGVSAPFAITVNETTNIPQFRAFPQPGTLGSTAGGGPTPTTPAISSTPEPSLAQAVEAALTKLAQGKILYNPPTQMTQGKEERVEVRVTQNITGDLNSGLQSSGAAKVEPVLVSPFMHAKLLGDDFSITPLSTDEQVVGETGFTEWVWKVVPEEAGDDKELHLIVTAQVWAKDIKGTKDLLVKDVKITVKVDPIYSGRKFIKNNWQWLATAIIIPLAVYAWTLRKRDQKDSGETKATERRQRKRR